MNTFLPYKSFIKSAQCLDYRRLGKQRVEAWQIYLALTQKNYGWKNHPIVKMWKGYEQALLDYGMVMCEEWINRGYQDTMWERFYNVFDKKWYAHKDFSKFYPNWLGNKKFHSSMRSNLLRKDEKHYSKFNWKEKNNLPYYWIRDKMKKKCKCNRKKGIVCDYHFFPRTRAGYERFLVGNSKTGQSYPH